MLAARDQELRTLAAEVIPGWSPHLFMLVCYTSPNVNPSCCFDFNIAWAVFTAAIHLKMKQIMCMLILYSCFLDMQWHNVSIFELSWWKAYCCVFWQETSLIFCSHIAMRVWKNLLFLSRKKKRHNFLWYIIKVDYANYYVNYTGISTFIIRENFYVFKFVVKWVVLSTSDTMTYGII